MLPPAMAAPAMVAPAMVAPAMMAPALMSPLVSSQPGSSGLQSQSSRPVLSSIKLVPGMNKINPMIKGLKFCHKLVIKQYF